MSLYRCLENKWGKIILGLNDIIINLSIFRFAFNYVKVGTAYACQEHWFLPKTVIKYYPFI